MKAFDRVLITMVTFAGMLFACIAIDALAGVGLKMEVPPFDAVIYELTEENGDMVTFERCEEIREQIVQEMIKDEDMDMLGAIENGDFIISCVERYEDGTEVDTSEVL